MNKEHPGVLSSMPSMYDPENSETTAEGRNEPVGRGFPHGEEVAIDLMGPYPKSEKGNKYALPNQSHYWPFQF